MFVRRRRPHEHNAACDGWVILPLHLCLQMQLCLQLHLSLQPVHMVLVLSRGHWHA